MTFYIIEKTPKLNLTLLLLAPILKQDPGQLLVACPKVQDPGQTISERNLNFKAVTTERPKDFPFIPAIIT